MTHLKQQLQRKLNLARTSQVPPDRPRSCNLTEARNRQIVLRLPEVWMVEQVERLAAELQRYPLLDLRVLGDCEVDIRKSGTGENVSAGITEPGGLADERRGIDPLVR